MSPPTRPHLLPALLAAAVGLSACSGSAEAPETSAVSGAGSATAGGTSGTSGTSGTEQSSKTSSGTSSGTNAGSGTAGGDEGTTTTGGTGAATSTTGPSASRTSKVGSTATTSTSTGAPFERDELAGRIERAVAKTPTAHVVITADSGGRRTTAEGDQDLETGELEMDLDMGGQTTTYRYVGDRYYLSQAPKWVEIDPASADPVQKALLGQMGMLSLRQQLDAFSAGLVDAGEKGEEDLDGVATTHYTAAVDMEKALSAIGLEPAAGTPETYVYEMWLDEEDLVRRMDVVLVDGTAMTLVADDWGLPVDVVRPAPSELARKRTP